MRLINVINQKIAFYRFLRLRHRDLLTRNNRLRLRYVVAALVVSSMTLTSLMGSSIAFVPSNRNIEVAGGVGGRDIVLASLPASQGVDSMDRVDDEEGIANGDVDGATLSLLLPIVEDDNVALDEGNVAGQNIDHDLFPREEIIKINSGDTIAGALQGAGVGGADAYRAIKAMSKHYDPRSIKPGQALSVYLERGDDGVKLSTLSMKINPIKEIVVARSDGGRFFASLNKKKVVLRTKAAKASIETSLYGSAARAGIPATIVADMIRVYSYDVDFQRDIRRGDKVEILYETYETEDGDFARYGDVIYANLMVGGKSIPVYRYELKDGNIDYYRENGMNLKRILMQTPIDGARMSSGYGMRHHPVLGYNKMHKGVDFAAPRGTPIYAAGDGVIDKAGRNGGYGNYIRIRHSNGLKTAYAHMRKFFKGMKAGKRVEQGQIIGYVGTTGRSTGPHLHFEVLKNGKQVNPKSVKSSSGKELAGNNLQNFKRQVLEIKKRYVALAHGLKFAQNNASE